MPPAHTSSEAEPAEVAAPPVERAADVALGVRSAADLGGLSLPVRAENALRLQRAAGNRTLARAVTQAPARLLSREPPPRSEHAGSTYSTITGQAFVQGAGDVGEIDANDVKQGFLGDCNLLAPMAAVARANPDRIRRLISANADGTYDVTLYYREWPWSDLTPHVFRVTSRFYVDDSGTPLYARFGDTGASGPELWVMLIEKAFARYKGSYESAGGSMWDKDGLELLTGNDATESSVSDGTEAELLTAISSALARGDAVTANTSTNRWGRWTASAEEEAEIDRLDIKINHAYSVESVNTTARTLNLRNPWGMNHLTNLPVAAFRRYPFRYWSRVATR